MEEVDVALVGHDEQRAAPGVRRWPARPRRAARPRPRRAAPARRRARRDPRPARGGTRARAGSAASRRPPRRATAWPPRLARALRRVPAAAAPRPRRLAALGRHGAPVPTACGLGTVEASTAGTAAPPRSTPGVPRPRRSASAYAASPDLRRSRSAPSVALRRPRPAPSPSAGRTSAVTAEPLAARGRLGLDARVPRRHGQAQDVGQHAAVAVGHRPAQRGDLGRQRLLGGDDLLQPGEPPGVLGCRRRVRARTRRRAAPRTAPAPAPRRPRRRRGVPGRRSRRAGRGGRAGRRRRPVATGSAAAGRHSPRLRVAARRPRHPSSPAQAAGRPVYQTARRPRGRRRDDGGMPAFCARPPTLPPAMPTTAPPTCAGDPIPADTSSRTRRRRPPDARRHRDSPWRDCGDSPGWARRAVSRLPGTSARRRGRSTPTAARCRCGRSARTPRSARRSGAAGRGRG